MVGLNPCSPKEDEGSGERRKKRKMHKEEEREVRVGWLASAHDVLVFFRCLTVPIAGFLYLHCFGAYERLHDRRRLMMAYDWITT